MKIKHLTNTVFAFLILSINAYSADTLKVTLNECLTLAFDQGPSAQSAMWDSLAAAGRWKTARGSKYPQITANGMLPRLAERTDYDLRYDPDIGGESYTRTLTGTQSWQGGIDIAQELPWGTTLTFSSELYRLRYYTESELSDTTIEFIEYSLMRSLVLDQPLLAGNPVGRSRKINEISHKTSLLDHEITRRNIRYQTMQSFFGLVESYGELDISHQDLMRGRQSDTLAQRKYKAGLIPEVEMLQIQVDVARRENSYRQTEASLESDMDRLRLMLGLPFDVVVMPSFDMNEITISSTENIVASGKRPELIRDELNLDRDEMETRASVLSERINASLQVYYEIDTRRDKLDDVGDSGDRNLGVTVSVSFPIFGFGTTQGRIDQIRASLARQKVDLIAHQAELASEMRSSLRNIELAGERIQIADAALELMDRSYNITVQRFESGLISSRTWLDAQIELTRTRREVLSARIDYELALANLERISPIDMSNQ